MANTVPHSQTSYVQNHIYNLDVAYTTTSILQINYHNDNIES